MDWSSDVCSSDLVPEPGPAPAATGRQAGAGHRGPDAALGAAQLSAGRRDRGADHRRRSAAAGDDGRLDIPRRPAAPSVAVLRRHRSEEHTSELQSLMRISYAVFCLKKKKKRLK